MTKTKRVSENDNDDDDGCEEEHEERGNSDDDDETVDNPSSSFMEHSFMPASRALTEKITNLFQADADFLSKSHIREVALKLST